MAKKKKQQYHDHLLREIANTDENRAFWHDIAKQMRQSDSRWTLRLRGRTPNVSKIMEKENCTLELAKQIHWRCNNHGGIALDIADTFAVYVVERKGYRRKRRDYSASIAEYHHEKGYQEGIAAGREEKLQHSELDDTDWKLVAEQRVQTLNELEEKRNNVGRINVDLSRKLGILEQHCTTYVATLEKLEMELVEEKQCTARGFNSAECVSRLEAVITYLEKRLETVIIERERERVLAGGETS